jgi:hypothetical protein
VTRLQIRGQKQLEFLNIVFAVDVGPNRNTGGKGKGVVWRRGGGFATKRKTKRKEERKKDIRNDI